MEQEHELNFLFHPILVHFPIAFYFLEFVLLLFWLAKQDESYLKFALFSFKSGYFFMILAMIAGLRDAGGFGEITGRVRTHALAAASVFAIYTARACFWRFGKTEDRFYKLTHILFVVVGNLLVALTGYFGGLLVYGGT